MKYEMMVIIRPLPDQILEEVVAKVERYVKEIGSVIKIDRWGKKYLSYEIKGETEGFYVLINFEADFKKVTQLDRKMYQISDVIRHMIVWRGGEIFGDKH